MVIIGVNAVVVVAAAAVAAVECELYNNYYR
jgi:hypothetical protein